MLGRRLLILWGFDVCDPVDVFQRCQPCLEGLGVGQVRPLTGQLQFALAVQTFQAGEEPAAELDPQRVSIHQPVAIVSLTADVSVPVTSLTADPAVASINRRSAARNQRVDMHVRVQFLVPRV